MRIERSLDALNFFLADVRDGLGPYLAIYLLTEQQWTEDKIGLVMSIAAGAGILAQTPAGALIDATHAKRALMVAAALVVTFASLVIPFTSSFVVVAGSQAASGAAAVFFAPAIAAITLGIMGPKAFTRRIGRNESFNHVGNAFLAALAGICAMKWGPIVVFYLLAVMALLSIASILTVNPTLIDHDRARGLRDGESKAHDRPSAIRTLATSRGLMIFCLCCVAFHLANAAMLPLVGQKLALQDRNQGTALMSACIVAAQVVMTPMAILVGRKADSWGRKPLFLAAFAILPLRGVLYTLSDNPYWLVGVQSLDGIGAGLYGALFPLIVGDLTRGTGHFNLAQGAVITAQGIGAALSTTLAGFIVVGFGYSAAFLTLAGIAFAGFVLYLLGMKETRDDGELVPPEAAAIAAQ
ncbi:MFS transporter [Methylocapsa palsarum]|uniref:Predicted arabinose efflux permease, MFS family n=1 Tax=Methylocapsa palsarum TaxID=1612308 RepID=A0A1I3Y8F2_9HYPH|nr:MFS transporter [Methylocapsa palsarum]SFK28095.1 Predicted arabinose efflux permease, MFS family [Methylocapsa palsarum]